MAPSAAEVIRPLRRVEYDQLVQLGAFKDERIELLEGALVAMSPIGTAHCSSVRKLNELLVLALHGRATVSCQLPFAALEFSEPEPDFAILPLSDYDADHPSEAYLIIEVSESSLFHGPWQEAEAVRELCGTGVLGRQPPRALHRGVHGAHAWCVLARRKVRARSIDSPRRLPRRFVCGL